MKVTPKEDGAFISINGFDITIIVKPSATPIEEAPTIPAPPRITVESVRSRLSEHIEELEVSEEVEGIVVRPRSYLGRDKFASIAVIIKELGGSYISAGKESRFLIPKKYDEARANSAGFLVKEKTAE